jgi:hypothetical protein
MAAGRFSKQAAPFLTGKLNANNNGDTAAGGLVTSAPSGLNINAWQQNLPGDRIILDPLTATAYSNNAVGNLYTGTYRYVGTANSTSSPVIGHTCVWECNNATGAASAAQDGLYVVNSDEPANHSVSLTAGVFINNITKTNFGWIQESGKATVKFRVAITGTPAVGAGVYMTAGGNNANAADVGSADQLAGANSAAIFTANSTTGYTTVDNMISRYLGVAEGLPSNNNLSLVDLVLNRASFRW